MLLSAVNQENLRKEFSRRFGHEAALVVRAPGRVNLIGEHTDYNGLPVLPFAIAQSHRMAVSVSGQPAIEMANLDPRYPAKMIAADELGALSQAGEWDNYVRAAILGLMDCGLVTRETLARGLRMLVASDLPAGVGLSSSSALVVASALAALHAWRIPYDRLHVAEVLAEAEHYVGTRGGGMDQTVCLLARERHVLRIDFFPLQVEPIVFAGDVEVFLGDSGVRVEKSGKGRALFNRRPLECRLALALLEVWAQSHGRSELTGARYWGDLVKPPIGLSHEAVLAMIREAVPQPRYSENDLSRALGISQSDLRETYLKISLDARPDQNGPSAEYFAEPADGFKLHQRAEHVMAEARRVEQAVEALRRSDIERLSDLIVASHASCRDLYEISCPELERLVAAATESGALGSRLTGAGFGGCTLHLVRRRDAAQFESAMRQRLGESLRLFRVAPSRGAEIL